MSPPTSTPPWLLPKSKRVPYVPWCLGASSMGWAFILGGDERISATAYEMIRTTGGAYIWGINFLVLGSLLGITGSLARRHRKYFRMTLVLGAAVYLILAVMFLVAAIRNPTANFTAIVAYGWISFVHVFAAERVREERTWMRRPLVRS